MLLAVWTTSHIFISFKDGFVFELDNKVAIVTGASRGIGAGLAVGLARAGATLLLVSRTAPDPDVILELEKIGKPFAHHTADMGKMESIGPVVEAALAHFGQIDILVNNAGKVLRTTFLDHSEAEWDDVVYLNLKVPVFLAQACARQMVKQGHGGKIINICSVLSFQGGILVVGYSASKHGLAGATKTMANDLARY